MSRKIQEKPEAFLVCFRIALFLLAEYYKVFLNIFIQISGSKTFYSNFSGVSSNVLALSDIRCQLRHLRMHHRIISRLLKFFQCSRYKHDFREYADKYTNVLVARKYCFYIYISFQWTIQFGIQSVNQSPNIIPEDIIFP